MTEVIATRDLIRIRPDGVSVTITVEIGRPEKTPDDFIELHGPWYATMRIIGTSEEPEVMWAGGDSSVEALMFAMFMPGVILRALPYADEFEFAQAANFLFPIPPIKEIVDPIMDEAYGHR